MNNIVYVGAIVVVLLIVAAVLVSNGLNTAGGPGSGSAPVGGSQPTTTAVGAAPYNSTTTVVQSNSTKISNSTPTGCTATKYFICRNLTFTSSELTVTIGQKTGLNWSSFGLGYAPAGTPINSGVPQGVTFYTANASSSRNVGTSLSNNATVTVQLPISELNATKGALWVCYLNSGLVYVGNGCIANAGGSGVPSYIEIATVNG